MKFILEIQLKDIYISNLITFTIVMCNWIQWASTSIQILKVIACRDNICNLTSIV